MKFLSKIGEFFMSLFDLIGAFVIRLTKIPEDIQKFNLDTNRKSNSNQSTFKEIIVKNIDTHKDILTTNNISNSDALKNYFTYSSKEKENLVLKLQLASGMFLVLAILNTFNYVQFYIFVILGLLLVAYLVYLLFTKIKVVYAHDFAAYRDFFLMYVAIGIIIVFISYTPSLMSVIYFEYLPTVSILFYTIILVMAVFVIFRLKYSRDYTFGIVLDSGSKTANVRVDYDICSNVKPDIYIVQNPVSAKDGDIVKITVEGKILSSSGNRPTTIKEIL